MTADVRTAEDVGAIFTRYRSAVRAEMVEAVADSVADPWMSGAIGYHLGWADDAFRQLAPGIWRPGGKKMRAALTLLAYEDAMHGSGLDAELDTVLPLAAAIELFHNFTLIHDDVQDVDRSRWGRPTLWTVCGEAEAINVGDCLYALSIGCLARLRTRGIGEAAIAEVTADLIRTAVDLAVGQHYDLAFERQADVTIPVYLSMIGGKTAALLRCATYGGALLAAGPERATAYGDYGTALGVAFQIRDDVLGIWGSEVETGKTSGRDIRRKKKSLPVVYAFQHAPRDQASWLSALYARPGELNAGEEAEVRDVLDAAGAQQFAEDLAQRYRDQAFAALDAAGSDDVDAGPFRAELRTLADFAISRTF